MAQFLELIVVLEVVGVVLLGGEVGRGRRLRMLLYFLGSCLQALLFFDVFFDLNLFNVVNDVVYVFGVRVLAEVCLLVRSTLARVL